MERGRRRLGGRVQARPEERDDGAASVRRPAARLARVGDLVQLPELAARHGDPLFTANAIQPRAAYAKLIDHYRERFEAYGHDPARAHVAAGSGGLLIADSHERAVARFKELYEAKVAQTFKPHLEGRAGYNTPFRTIEDAIADGPQLIGSPQQIIDKILGYHEVYRHDLQSVTVDAYGQGTGEQVETLQRFAEEIAPAIRREAPSSLWE